MRGDVVFLLLVSVVLTTLSLIGTMRGWGSGEMTVVALAGLNAGVLAVAVAVMHYAHHRIERSKS